MIAPQVRSNTSKQLSDTTATYVYPYKDSLQNTVSFKFVFISSSTLTANINF